MIRSNQVDYLGKKQEIILRILASIPEDSDEKGINDKEELHG